MTVITISGSKVNVTGDAAMLRKISSALKKPIVVGNQHVQTSVSIPAKKLPLVKQIIQRNGG